MSTHSQTEINTGYPLHRKNARENIGNLEILPKQRESQGIWFAQVVNSLILKVKDIFIFASKIKRKKMLSLISLPSQFCV